jgi:glucose/arabinose dehydrogenase
MVRTTRAVLSVALAIVGGLGAVPADPAFAVLTGAAIEAPRPFVEGLELPTNMAFAPDGRLFFTEKETGRVRVVRPDGTLNEHPFVRFDVIPDAERGLLGIALDPRFDRDPWVYLYFSDARDGRNRLVRVRADGSRAGETQVLLDGLPASSGYHNGGDLAFGLDGTLFVTIGEVHESERAQDVNDLGGKIVRLNPDGSIPSDDPFGGSNPVWSYGHRNSFGICVDPSSGALWETENGPDVDDEVNRIRRGGNYGWPLVTGRNGGDELVRPVVVFRDTIALTGCAVVEGSLYFGAFDGELFRLPAGAGETGRATRIATFPTGVTDVVLGPDGRLYVATSDAIWTLEPARATQVSPSIAVRTSTAAASAPPAASGNGGSGIPPWVTIVAALAVAGGLALRLVAGRRLRRDRGGPG